MISFRPSGVFANRPLKAVLPQLPAGVRHGVKQPIGMVPGVVPRRHAEHRIPGVRIQFGRRNRLPAASAVADLQPNFLRRVAQGRALRGEFQHPTAHRIKREQDGTVSSIVMRINLCASRASSRQTRSAWSRPASGPADKTRNRSACPAASGWPQPCRNSIPAPRLPPATRPGPAG